MVSKILDLGDTLCFYVCLCFYVSDIHGFVILQGWGFSLVDGIQDDKKFRDAFLAFLVYQWMCFGSKPNAPKLQNRGGGVIISGKFG